MTPLSTRAVLAEHARAGTEVLDGFRGLAILLVLVYHTWLFSWYTPDVRAFGVALPFDVVARTGYLGVELFFFISAFVLFFPIVDRHARGVRQTGVRAFAYRRFLKIAPSYAIALAATAWSVRSLHVPVALPFVLAQHALSIQNFFTNNFGQANSVFWSLGVEVQFYLVFPLLAWTFVRWPLATAFAMVATALAYRYGVAPCCLAIEPVTRQVPAFLDIFAAGMLCAYGVCHLRERPALASRLRPFAPVVIVAAVAGLWALLVSANAITYDTDGRERWILFNRTFLALGIGSLVFASAFAANAVRRTIANPVLVYLSLVSYNLYLWHTLVMIWLWKHHAIASATHDPHGDGRWKFAFIASGWALSLAISTAITYFVERPLLATHAPQNFSFDWRRLTARSPRVASSETRT